MSKYKDQLSQIFEALKHKPMTMKELDISTGVMRENICRYFRTLRKQGKIALIKKRQCAITKHIAGEYTTNPELFPEPTKQLSIWS